MKLIEYVSRERGGFSRLAEAIGVHPVLVTQWANGTRPVPLKHCVSIERATLQYVRCEELRPDERSFFSYLRNSRFA